MTYASTTSVSVARSQAEIRATVLKYGGRKFAVMEDFGEAAVSFEFDSRRATVHIYLPHPDDAAFRRKRAGGATARGEPDAGKHEQACRAKWRALALVVKAKLEAVASGIGTFESEFLAHIVLPNGQRVGQWLKPQLETAFKNGRMPPLLGGG